MEFDELNKTISYLEEFMKNYKFDSDIKDFFKRGWYKLCGHNL